MSDRCPNPDKYGQDIAQSLDSGDYLQAYRQGNDYTRQILLDDSLSETGKTKSLNNLYNAIDRHDKKGVGIDAELEKNKDGEVTGIIFGSKAGPGF